MPFGIFGVRHHDSQRRVRASDFFLEKQDFCDQNGRKSLFVFLIAHNNKKYIK